MAIPVAIKDTDIGIEYGESAILTRWLKKPGETVTEGEDLLEVESSKATAVIPAPASGVLGDWRVAEGQEWEIKHPVAFILQPGEAEPVELPADEPAIDSATGQSGPRSTTTPARRPVQMTAMRRTIAERMQRSTQTSARVTLSTDVDMSQALASRQQWLSSPPPDRENDGLSFTALFAKSAAQALGLHPGLNATFENDQIWLYEEVNIGFALDVPNGLVVPVLRAVNQKDLWQLSSEIKRLRERAQAGTLHPLDLQGGTFHISNLGMHDIDFFTPILNPPACAIMGIGRIRERAVPVGGKLEIRPIVTLSLAFDHRVTDGAPAAAFLSQIKAALEAPENLLAL